MDAIVYDFPRRATTPSAPREERYQILAATLAAEGYKPWFAREICTDPRDGAAIADAMRELAGTPR